MGAGNWRDLMKDVKVLLRFGSTNKVVKRRARLLAAAAAAAAALVGR